MSDPSTARQARRPTWLEISRSALTNNVRQIKSRLAPTTRLMAVVKANAYGHGDVATARVLSKAGADAFAVAAFGEALTLREGGIAQPILVLGYTPRHLIADAVANEVMLTVYDTNLALAIAAAAQKQGNWASVHLKVNTGMNRLGVDPSDAAALLKTLRSWSLAGLTVEGIFTHFATADTDLDFAQEQFGRFAELLDELAAQGLRPPIAHCANSAATLALPDTHLDMVRCGIALYGLDPDVDGAPLPAEFVPALSWKAEVAQVRTLQPGDSVSYGREFVAQHAMTVATVPVGYADGFPRRPFNWGSVLLHGLPAPILGRVCMDQCIIDVSAQAAHQPVETGDEVVLIGKQGNAELSAAEAAARIGTINYDVVSRILPRVPRLYVD